MIENTTARQWLLIATLGFLVLVLWRAIPTTNAALGVIGGVLLVGGGFGLAWRLLAGR